jgi:amidase
MPSSPRTWSAIETAARFRAGEVSAEEIVADHLAAAAEHAALGAITRLDETARDQARALDRRRADGEALGPLAGVPVTIKDNVDVAGQSSPNGVAALDAAVAATDAPTVSHLRRAGAVILGRTNTPEFSWRWHTDNPLFGPTANPRRPDLTPGGSSGGAAAALAVGIGCLAQGNDAGGSVRWPAACCGVSALRPTQGRIPGHAGTAPGERPLGIDLMATQGPMARTVADVAAMFEVLGRPSWLDPAQVPAPDPGWDSGSGSASGPGLDSGSGSGSESGDGPRRGPGRVGVLSPAALSDGGPVHPEVVAALDRAVAHFDRAGWSVREVAVPSLAASAEAWARLINTDFAVRTRPLMEREGSAAVAAVLQVFDRVGPPLDLPELYDVLALRATQLRAWQQVLSTEVDVVLVPVANEPAWPVDDDLASTARMEEIFRANTPLVAFNFLGLPAGAQPVGEVDGRPAAVQLVARRFAEAAVLTAASVLEAAHPVAVVDR